MVYVLKSYELILAKALAIGYSIAADRAPAYFAKIAVGYLIVAADKYNTPQTSAHPIHAAMLLARIMGGFHCGAIACGAKLLLRPMVLEFPAAALI